MRELKFEDECLEALRVAACSRSTGGKDQVAIDLRRIDALSIEDHAGSVWSYVRKSNHLPGETQALAELVELGPDEGFFNRIKSLDEKFQDFMLQNFHQGGMFFVARQFLTFYINSLGFMLDNEHHFVCKLGVEEVEVEEIFFVKGLTFIASENVMRIAYDESGELSSLDLEESEREKINYFQEQIKKSVCNGCSKDNDETFQIRLEENASNKEPQIVLNAKNENLIEFTVKHTIQLDPKSKEISIKKLSAGDVSFKIQPQLYSLSAETSPTAEFTNFLSLELSAGFFQKARTESSIKDLILNNYRELIQLLRRIICYLISSFQQPAQPSESENNFAYRMRA